MTPCAPVGAGPGPGPATARRFGRADVDIAPVARGQYRLDGLAAELDREGVHARGFAADVCDPQALIAALDAVTATPGVIEVPQCSPVPRAGSTKPLPDTSPLPA
ncbi:hypothetical protein ABZ371_01235 [Streptomyces sp. NPDC005899]|uniref:hypothetical protein n=1 Tax=Streptomyces sp. NPDC005899 TaxID=3155716 RepID=UPI0033CE53D6